MRSPYVNILYSKISWLIVLLLISIIFTLYLKALTPKTFISVIKYKYYGYVKPEIDPNQLITYLSKKDIDEIDFYGHRGGVPEWLYPENSLLAFQFGSLMGLRYLEIDLRLTKDKIPLVFHDDYMERLTGVGEFVKNLDFEQIKKINYRDGQSILTLRTLLKYQKNLLIDLSGNNYVDAVHIIDYILDEFSNEIHSSIILQFADPNLIDYVSKKNKIIKISYNEWGERIRNVKKYKNYSEIFTLNPSSEINENIIKEIGVDKMIIAVVQGDNINEIIRLKNIMISNSIIINRSFFNTSVNNKN
jgi:hypothetical protein